MSIFHDEVEIEDFDYDEELGAFPSAMLHWTPPAGTPRHQHCIHVGLARLTASVVDIYR